MSSSDTLIIDSTVKELTDFFSKHAIVKKTKKTKKSQIIRQLVLNALLNCVRKYFKKPTVTYEIEFEDRTTAKIKTLKTFFSRHKLYVNATTNKKNKVLRLLILNALLNCIRAHFNKPAVSFEKDFDNGGVTEKRQYIPDIRDQCWSSRRILHDLGYNVFVDELFLARSMQKIKQTLRYNSDISDLHLTEAITAVVNNIYPDDNTGYDSLMEQVLFEIEKRNPRPAPIESEVDIVVLPLEVDISMFDKYMSDIKKHTKFGTSEYVQFAIARFIMSKHNKLPLPTVDKLMLPYLSQNINKKDLIKTNSIVRKRLTELLRANII